MIEIRSFRDLLRLFFIYRREFLWALGLTAVLAVAGAFLLPTRYASEAKLLVKPGRENLAVPIEAGDRPTVVPQTTQRDPIVDEEKMLTGRPVVQKVVQRYLAEVGEQGPPQGFFARIKHELKRGMAATIDGLRTGLAAIGLTELRSPEDRLAEKLAERFQVTHASGSAVMEMRFSWDDPVVAQKVMAAWVQAYQEERARVLGRDSLVAFYTAKSDQAQQEIDAYKAAIREQLLTINGISAQERLEAVSTRMNELRSRQAEIGAERAALERGVAVGTSRAASLPKEIEMEREVGFGPTWTALNAQLSDLRRQRAELLRVYKETAPPVVALDETIRRTEAQLQAEERDVQRSRRFAPNELTTTLQRGALEKSVRLEELKRFAASYAAELDQLEAERRRILGVEPELARLQQALAVAEKNRGLYLDNLEKARIDQALDASRISNVAVVEAATFNPARVSPPSLALLLAALPAGAFVGLLTVYLCSLLDQRVHDGGGMQARFGVPLWTTVREVRSAADEDNAFQASVLHIVGMLPMARLEQGLTVGLTAARRGEGAGFLISRLHALLQEQGVPVQVNPESGRAAPGHVALLNASGLLDDRQALMRLTRADVVLLVVQARSNTVPMVENALTILRNAVGKVDGVIVNRRHFEVPAGLLRLGRPAQA
ncbi:MAG: GumC family protein [Pseudomonadota bacterium]